MPADRIHHRFPGKNPCDTGAIRLTKTHPDRAQQLRDARWIDIIQCEIPALKHNPGQRLPMIMWHGVGYQPLEKMDIEILRSRGLCQHLPLDTSMIPAALALQNAGMPVILMQGRTDHWPYSLVEDSKDWAHQFEPELSNEDHDRGSYESLDGRLLGPDRGLESTAAANPPDDSKIPRFRRQGHRRLDGLRR